MQNRWTTDHARPAECPSCRKLVHARIEYRTVRLDHGRLCVSNALVDVCPECDATIDIPRGAFARLLEASAPQ